MHTLGIITKANLLWCSHSAQLLPSVFTVQECVYVCAQAAVLTWNSPKSTNQFIGIVLFGVMQLAETQKQNISGCRNEWDEGFPNDWISIHECQRNNTTYKPNQPRPPSLVSERETTGSSGRWVKQNTCLCFSLLLAVCAQIPTVSPRKKPGEPRERKRAGYE